MVMSTPVDAWVNGYLLAWQTNDSNDIASLFAADARYFAEPYGEPAIGRDAIVALWLEAADEAGTTSFEWSCLSYSDDLAFVRGVTRYPTASYSNLWVIRFDSTGAATEFTDWWMPHPEAVQA
jgi:ketosteroid isomerase-like protein